MTPVSLSKVEAPIRAVIHMLAGFNNHDAQTLSETLAETVSLYCHLPLPDNVNSYGIAEVVGYFDALFNNWPEIRLEVEDLFGMGNRSVLRWKTACGQDSSGQKWIRGVAIFTLINDSVSEMHIYSSLHASTA